MCYHSGSVHTQTHTQRHEQKCMQVHVHNVFLMMVVLHSPCLMRVGVRYFAFLLGVASVTNIPVSRVKGVSLKTGETAGSLLKFNVKHQCQDLCSLYRHTYYSVRHQSVG